MTRKMKQKSSEELLAAHDEMMRRVTACVTEEYDETYVMAELSDGIQAKVKGLALQVISKSVGIDERWGKTDFRLKEGLLKQGLEAKVKAALKELEPEITEMFNKAWRSDRRNIVNSYMRMYERSLGAHVDACIIAAARANAMNMVNELMRKNGLKEIKDEDIPEVTNDI